MFSKVEFFRNFMECDVFAHVIIRSLYLPQYIKLTTCEVTKLLQCFQKPSWNTGSLTCSIYRCFIFSFFRSKRLKNPPADGFPHKSWVLLQGETYSVALVLAGAFKAQGFLKYFWKNWIVMVALKPTSFTWTKLTWTGVWKLEVISTLEYSRSYSASKKQAGKRATGPVELLEDVSLNQVFSSKGLVGNWGLNVNICGWVLPIRKLHDQGLLTTKDSLVIVQYWSSFPSPVDGALTTSSRNPAALALACFLGYTTRCTAENLHRLSAADKSNFLRTFVRCYQFSAKLFVTLTSHVITTSSQDQWD